MPDCTPENGKVVEESFRKFLLDLSSPAGLPRYTDRDTAFREWDRERTRRMIWGPEKKEFARVGKSLESGIQQRCESGELGAPGFCRELQRTQRKQFRLFRVGRSAEVAASFDPGDLDSLTDLGDFERAEGMLYLRFRFGK